MGFFDGWTQKNMTALTPNKDLFRGSIELFQAAVEEPDLWDFADIGERGSGLYDDHHGLGGA